MKTKLSTVNVVKASIPRFHGDSNQVPCPDPVAFKGNGAPGAKCEDYLGSPTNLIVAGRFGIAPSANRKATAGLKLVDRESGLQTGDPAAFTVADTLAFGALGHIIGVGVVLGLKNLGAI